MPANQYCLCLLQPSTPQGLPYLVDSFAMSLARAAKDIGGAADAWNDNNKIKKVLEDCLATFKEQFLDVAKKFTGTNKYLLGPIGSLQLWLKRITEAADDQLPPVLKAAMLHLIKTSCWFSSAIPCTLLEDLLVQFLASDLSAPSLATVMGALEDYGNVLGRIKEDFTSSIMGHMHGLARECARSIFNTDYVTLAKAIIPVLTERILISSDFVGSTAGYVERKHLATCAHGFVSELWTHHGLSDDKEVFTITTCLGKFLFAMVSIYEKYMMHAHSSDHVCDCAFIFNPFIQCSIRVMCACPSRLL